MIRNISVKEFVKMMEKHLREDGKIKETEKFEFIGINPKDQDKFFEIEVSKK
jgi:predicted urease superfamily metal-dependent hydrolase